MSNINNEFEYTRLEDVMAFALQQFIKDLYTALPGLIVVYNPETKRATIQPALNTIFTDGITSSLPILQDVPVIFPAGGGYTLTFPLKNGDPVLILFSKSGIENFKTNYKQGLPSDGVMSLENAVAIPGFGALNITPASSSGFTAQSEDGANAIIIESEKVELKLGEVASVLLEEESIELKLGGATLTLTESALISSVPIEAPSYSGDDGGAATMTAGIDMDGQSITNANDVTASGVSLKTHVHSGVTTGGNNTGGPA